MASILMYLVPILIILAVYLYKNKVVRKRNESVKESLEDETIFVEGLGNVRIEEFEDQDDEDHDIKSENIFSDGLMKFEGKFLIDDVPLNEERRLSIDDAFLYLQELFGKDIINRKPMRTLDDPLFRKTIKDKSDVINLASQIALIMDIQPAQIELDFFSEEEWDDAAGLYHGKGINGKYKVTLLDNIYLDIEKCIATIAHEFAHIKLLGEERMEENSEELTDIVPLMYGFGLFNSNSVFKLSGDNLERSWSTSQLGYLSQSDWGYLFALYRYVTADKEPKWLNHLNKTTAKDSQLAYDFILNNPEKVLQQLS